MATLRVLSFPSNPQPTNEPMLARLRFLQELAPNAAAVIDSFVISALREKGYDDPSWPQWGNEHPIQGRVYRRPPRRRRS